MIDRQVLKELLRNRLADTARTIYKVQPEIGYAEQYAQELGNDDWYDELYQMFVDLSNMRNRLDQMIAEVSSL